jgi:hypothetical protein
MGERADRVALATLGTLASAADPPPGSVEEAVEIARKIGSRRGAQHGRELRKRADQGDADATYQFALLLMMHGRFGPAANEKTVAEWDKLGDRRPASDWLFRPRKVAVRDAIDHVCGMAEDRLAPADLRDKGQAKCAELRGKFPAQ